MLTKNIAKKSLFVTTFCAICLIFANCGLVSSSNSKAPTETKGNYSINYSKPKVVGIIKSDEIHESSGLVNSRCQSDVFWTHNDSGDAEFIFAINEKGDKLGTWKVPDSKNHDWEDIATYKDAAGQCYLYLGDIGNNGGKKNEFTIYKVPEPQISEAEKQTNRKNPSQTEPAEAIKFSYPDGPHNAETLMVHPVTGDIYVLTKHMSNVSEVFKIGAKTVKVANFSVPSVPNGLLTGGEISPDGRHVVICDYVAGYEISLPDGDQNFDDIWKQNVNKIDLGEREQGEAICYSADGSKIYATSEKRHSPLIEIDRE